MPRICSHILFLFSIVIPLQMKQLKNSNVRKNNAGLKYLQFRLKSSNYKLTTSERGCSEITGLEESWDQLQLKSLAHKEAHKKNIS